MKSGEPFQLGPEAGKDFKGKDLRGMSFRGANLSGANFSGADLRGTNFSNALLHEADFSGALTGLQRSQALTIVMVLLLLAAVLGVGAGLLNMVIELTYHGSSFVAIIPKRLVLIVVAGFAFVALRHGITASFIVFIGAFVVADALAFISPLTVPVAGAIAVAILIASAVGVATAALVTIAVTAAMAAKRKAALVVIAVFGLTFIPVAVISRHDSAIFTALAVMGLSTYIGWRTLKGDERHNLIRIFAMSLTARWGTSFRNADLTKADFTEALIRNTDFRGAILTRTRWSEEAEESELSEFII
jgi:hypothetical protein